MYRDSRTGRRTTRAASTSRGRASLMPAAGSARTAETKPLPITDKLAGLCGTACSHRSPCQRLEACWLTHCTETYPLPVTENTAGSPKHFARLFNCSSLWHTLLTLVMHTDNGASYRHLCFTGPPCKLRSSGQSTVSTQARLAAMSGVRREGAESRMIPATAFSTLSGAPTSARRRVARSSFSVLAGRHLSFPTPSAACVTALASPSKALAARLRNIVPKKMKPALLHG